jgi:hypothetical protein|eukprot:COSAG06_NODE_5117_length_3711_cov_2.387320_3_plen_65_part_00
MPGLTCNCETMQATCELPSGGGSEGLAVLVLCAVGAVALSRLLGACELQDDSDDEDAPPSGMFT